MNRKTTLVLFSLILASATLAAAQGRQASVDALNKWTANLTSTSGTGDTSFQAFAVAVEPRSASGLTVDLAVGMSQNIKTMPALTIAVQMVNVDKSGFVQELGQSGKIVSPSFERTGDDKDAVLFTPRVTVSDVVGANAVRVTVQGLDDNAPCTILVPVSSKMETAVLGRVQPNEGGI